MITNTQMEKLWQRYQTEGVARNISMQQFCSMNNVPYNSFEKYLLTRRNMPNGYQVKVTDTPDERAAENKPEGKATVQRETKDLSGEPQKGIRIFASIRMTNGLNITQGNLSYQELKALVEKLEVLC